MAEWSKQQHQVRREALWGSPLCCSNSPLCVEAKKLQDNISLPNVLCSEPLWVPFSLHAQALSAYGLETSWIWPSPFGCASPPPTPLNLPIPQAVALHIDLSGQVAVGVFLIEVEWGSKKDPENLVIASLLPHSVVPKATPGNLRNIEYSIHLPDSCWYLLGLNITEPGIRATNAT